MIQLGLLGNGIGHSRAKSLHELIGEILGLEIHYQPIDLAGRQDVEICEELFRCQSAGYAGVNITHPYKREAFNCVEVLDDFPTGLTSINTVVFRPGHLLAANTDYSGFLSTYINHYGRESKPGRVLMLGTGGVGLAIAFALQNLGCSELVVRDEIGRLGRSVVDQLRKHGLPIRLADKDLVEEMRAADGLVNATPVGMHQYPGIPFPPEGLGGQRWAFDAVYTPEITTFLSRCREFNIDTISGFKLFLHQGFDAFKQFTGVDIDRKIVEEVYLERYPLQQTTGPS